MLGALEAQLATFDGKALTKSLWALATLRQASRSDGGHRIRSVPATLLRAAATRAAVLAQPPSSSSSSSSSSNNSSSNNGAAAVTAAVTTAVIWTPRA